MTQETGARAELQARFEVALDDDSRLWWAKAQARIDASAEALPELLPALARRTGRQPLASSSTLLRQPLDDDAAATLDLAAWRACDVAGLELIERARSDDAALTDLVLRGDLEERTIVLRSLGLRPVDDVTVRLLGEVQRTNTVSHFEAAVCDNDLAARAVGRAGFTTDDFNRLIMKAAFWDLRFARFLDGTSRANAELSRMVQGLATEREAAGRTPWADTDSVISAAPTAGSVLRLLGGIEHGSDERRAAAAAALLNIAAPNVPPLIRDRIDREPVSEIRETLERVARAWEEQS